MPDFTKLWDQRYLFGPNPLDLSRSDTIFFSAGAGFVALGMALKFFALRNSLQSPKRFLLSRLFHLFLTTGLLVLLWSGARFENIPWLSTHIVVLAVCLLWLIWLIFIIRYSVGQYRTQQKLWQEEEVKKKYFVKR